MTSLTEGHVWVPADRVIRWEYCSVCLIIRRADNCNSPCKGSAKVAVRKAYSNPHGGPEFDAP